jgi:Tol biopolymer transport system component
MTRLVAAALAALAIGATASDARTAARASGDWIVFSSDRDGTERAYSVRPNGSRLTPLFGPRALVPLTVSAGGGMIAYRDRKFVSIYVSRANGTRLRRVVGTGVAAALSSNGKQLAFTFGEPAHIGVVGTDGRGMRRLTSGYADQPSWSPDGKEIAFHGAVGARDRPGSEALFVQPLRGRRRLLVRAPGAAAPRWSPDGRWIAYQLSQGSRNGLYVVRPNGKRRHRVVAGYISAFAWSPNGGRLAVALDLGRVLIVGVDGRVSRRMRLRLQSGTSTLAWSPDGRRLALQAGTEIWRVGVDGGGLGRIEGRGHSVLVGWAQLAPVGPPAPPLPPSERVVAADTVATHTPVVDLSADGERVAFTVAAAPADCDHVVVWAPGAKGLTRFGRPAVCGEGNGAGAIYDVELAGARAAWAQIGSCGNTCDVSLESATLARHAPLALAAGYFNSSDDGFDFRLHGAGDLLVFNDGSRLVRIGAGSERCQERGDYDTRICSTLRRSLHAVVADSVSGGLIAVREPDAVAIVDAQGALVRFFPFGPNDVDAARLDGSRLVVTRPSLIEVYDVTTGAGQLQRALPTGYALEDVDGGIAVLRRGGSIMLLRLADGRSFTMAPGRDPVSADLDSLGLYYSYRTPGGGGRVVFLTRAEVVRRLGG